MQHITLEKKISEKNFLRKFLKSILDFFPYKTYPAMKR